MWRAVIQYNSNFIWKQTFCQSTNLNKNLRNAIIESLFVFVYFKRFIAVPSLHTADIRFMDFLNLMFQTLHDFPLLSQEYAWVVSLFMEVSSLLIKILMVDNCFAIFAQNSFLRNSILFEPRSTGRGFPLLKLRLWSIFKLSTICLVGILIRSLLLIKFWTSDELN